MKRISLAQLLSGQQYVCSRCIVRQRLATARRLTHTLSTRPEQSVLSLLEQRGYVNQIAGDRNALNRLLQTRSVGFYAGIDPTAPSLHLGHLLPLMVLFWLYHHGHHVVSLVGGATAKVGDPSGRLTSRVKTAEAVMDANFGAMLAQVGTLWNNALKYGKRHGAAKADTGRLELLNNADWLDKLDILRFLRMMGSGIRLGPMLSRDTVRNKMEQGDGMSFAEFTYPLLQGWDWWQMFCDRAIQVQVGGSDQFGNIVAGIDGVRHIAQTNPEASDQQWLDAEGRLKDEFTPMGLTVPLLTTSSGEKFGKSAGNAVWLDPTLTSPFDLYGFLLRSSDTDVERYLKLFTFVSLGQISAIMTEHKTDPGKRIAQHLLATEVIELVHGPEQAAKTRTEHQTMRRPTLRAISSKATTEVNQETLEPPSTAMERTKLPKSLVQDTPFARVLYHAGLVPSRSEGARLIGKAGAYVAAPSDTDELNFVPITTQDATDLIKNGLLILRMGKWKVRVIEILEDEQFDNGGHDAPGWEAFRDRVRRLK